MIAFQKQGLCVQSDENYNHNIVTNEPLSRD